MITAISFTGTLAAVHYARYSPLMYGMQDARFRKIVSYLAVGSGMVASLSLILLTIFDTFHWHAVHGPLLLACFVGLGTSAVCTSIVYFDQAWGQSEYKKLKRWCIANTSFLLLDIACGICFTAFLWTNHMRMAGVFEWVLTYIGAGYLFTFVGFVAYVILYYVCMYETLTQCRVASDNEKRIGNGEDQPLLQERR